MRIFTSFHHEENEDHARKIISIVEELGHTDISVNDGNKIENEESLTSEAIRRIIRDKFLKDVDVTILIAGSEVKNRKHLDWEIRSTIHRFDNGKDGAIVVVNVLSDKDSWILAPELQREYDGGVGRSWAETVPSFDCLPARLQNSISDNFDYEKSLNGDHQHAVFPIVAYDEIISNHSILEEAINQALEYRKSNRGKWDVQTPMKRSNDESESRPVFDQVEA